MNAALYGRRSKHWALTERRRTSLTRSASHLGIGNSTMSWDGNALTIEIDELAIPRFSLMKGKVRLYPNSLADCELALDTTGRHRWRPIAPHARVDVQMTQPQLRWCGSGYFDSNAGAAALEDDFKTWTWSRSDTGDGATVLYDVGRRQSEPLAIALRFGPDGRHEEFVPPLEARLRRTLWRIGRQSRSEDGEAAVIRTLEDTPFYARSVISSRLLGEQRISVHESLSLDRFGSRVVQAMLPFRMPRAWR